MNAGDIALGPEFVAGTPDEARQIGAITADAFRTDPFNRWLLGTQAAIAGIFGTLAKHVYVPRGCAYRLADEGAAMWMLPGGDSEPPLSALPSLYWTILARASRGAKRRVDRTVAAMAEAHPPYPHAYLFTIGVRPRSQGKGLGRRIIAPVLQSCDRAGLPAYLENSNPANHGFYTACGFERIGWIEPMPGSPPMEAMVRRPRG